MAVRIYAKKVDEDEKMVYYSFGLIKDDLMGLVKIEKRNLKISIEDEKSKVYGEKLKGILLESIVNEFNCTKRFPDEVSTSI